MAEEISLSEYTNRPKSSSNRPVGLPPRVGLLVAAAVVLVGVGFFAGMQYQKGKTPTVAASKTASTSSNGSSGASGYGGGFRRGDRAFGTVTAVSSSSITIQNSRTGSADTYTLTSSTTVTDSGQSSSISAIQTGDTVMVTLDSSNTQDVTAIMLNPSFGGGAGGYSGGSSGNSGSSSEDDSSGASPSGASGA